MLAIILSNIEFNLKIELKKEDTQYDVRFHNIAYDTVIPVSPLHYTQGYKSSKPL